MEKMIHYFMFQEQIKFLIFQNLHQISASFHPDLFSNFPHRQSIFTFSPFFETPPYFNYNHKFKYIHSHKLNPLKRHNIQDNIQIKMESEKKAGRISLPQKDLTVSQLAAVLNVLAKEYHTTLPALLRKLDRVSGSLEELDRVYSGDHKFEWSQEEDSLLEKNQSLLVRWKGQQAVDVRKKYLQWKSK